MLTTHDPPQLKSRRSGLRAVAEGLESRQLIFLVRPAVELLTSQVYGGVSRVWRLQSLFDDLPK